MRCGVLLLLLSSSSSGSCSLVAIIIISFRPLDGRRDQRWVLFPALLLSWLLLPVLPFEAVHHSLFCFRVLLPLICAIFVPAFVLLFLVSLPFLILSFCDGAISFFVCLLLLGAFLIVRAICCSWCGILNLSPAAIVSQRSCFA